MLVSDGTATPNQANRAILDFPEWIFRECSRGTSDLSLTEGFQKEFGSEFIKCNFFERERVIPDLVPFSRLTSGKP